MRYRTLLIVASALAMTTPVANAGEPANVKCAATARMIARNGGAEYGKIYDRNYELCMVNAMPRERQTDYFIETLKPYVAVFPGDPPKQLNLPPLRVKKQKVARNWVRVTPNVWVLQ